MTEDDEEKFKNDNNCSFCGKKIKTGSDEVRDQCNLLGKDRGAAHRKCNINVTQKQFRIDVTQKQSNFFDTICISQF